MQETAHDIFHQQAIAPNGIRRCRRSGRHRRYRQSSARRSPEVPASEQLAKPKPSRGGGYTLSEHVKQYYKTTRV